MTENIISEATHGTEPHRPARSKHQAMKPATRIQAKSRHLYQLEWWHGGQCREVLRWHITVPYGRSLAASLRSGNAEYRAGLFVLRNMDNHYAIIRIYEAKKQFAVHR